MESNDTLGIFDQTGAYLRGHFRLTSGLHSPEYLQCAKVLQWPQHAAHFGQQLAAKLLVVAPQIEAVIAPAIGGLIIGHEVARHLNVRFIFAEREQSGQMSIRRGFEIQPGEKIVVIEDVITTGGSTFEVARQVLALGGNVVAAASIIDRSGGTVDLGMPRVALTTLQVITYQPDHCPLCAQGLPVTKPGSRTV